MDTKRCEDITINAHAGDTIYTKSWSVKRRNGGLMLGEVCSTERKKTMTLGESVFICICCNQDSHYYVGLYRHDRYCAAAET